MRSLNYARFKDAGLLARLGTPGKGLALLLQGGFYKINFMHGWIASLLEECGVRTWRDLKYTDDGADTHLALEQRYKLVVVSDISRGRMLRLPWDYQTLCDLDLDNQKRDRLFNNGTDAAEEFLKEWDWEQWQKKYGKRT